MQQSTQYKFQISSLSSFKFFYLNTQKFLIVKTKNNFFTSIVISNSIIVNQQKNLLSFELLTHHKFLYKSFLNFQKFIFYIFKNLNKKFKKTLILKGLGLRIKHFSKTNLLELKLGFSNLIYVSIPLSIKVYSAKNLLTFESDNPSLVGNFAYLVQSFRYPNSYKGKGFWYKNQEMKLKLIKKI